MPVRLGGLRLRLGLGLGLGLCCDPTLEQEGMSQVMSGQIEFTRGTGRRRGESERKSDNDGRG